MAVPASAGLGSNLGSNAAPAMPEPSGPSEVTRIINASKMRESALRSGGGVQDQPAAAPQPTGGAPGMPAMPGGMKFTPPQMNAPQMNPQAMMHPGGMGGPGPAASGGMGTGMGGGGMQMPHMQMPQMQMPQMNMQPPAAPAPAAPAAAPSKLQQMIPLFLVVIIFLLIALIVTVVFVMKH
jgi:hypothetical protein